MIVLEVLVAAVVLFALAAVAAGRGGGMADAPRDGAGTGLPDGPFDAPALERLRFSTGRRGYRVSEVDEVLDRVAGELARRDERIRQLSGHAAGPDRSAGSDLSDGVDCLEGRDQADRPGRPDHPERRDHEAYRPPVDQRDGVRRDGAAAGRWDGEPDPVGRDEVR